MGAILNYVLPKNPVTERRELHFIPAFVEKFVGAHAYASLVTKEGGEVIGSDYVEIVERVGENLAQNAKRKDLAFEFKVIKSDDDNAWCLPGGKIGINLGLIQKIEKEADNFTIDGLTLDDKIAAVLSHEIIHADARHTGRALEIRLFLMGIIKAAQVFLVHMLVPSNKQIDEARKAEDTKKVRELTKVRDDRSKLINALFELLSGWLISGLTLCKSRSHELESDRYGMILMKENKTYKPQAAIWLQSFFQKHHPKHDHTSRLGWLLNLFSTHPAPSERLHANRKTWIEIKV